MPRELVLRTVILRTKAPPELGRWVSIEEIQMANTSAFRDMQESSSLQSRLLSLKITLKLFCSWFVPEGLNYSTCHKDVQPEHPCVSVHKSQFLGNGASPDEWLNKIRYIYPMGIYTAIKKRKP